MGDRLIDGGQRRPGLEEVFDAAVADGLHPSAQHEPVGKRREGLVVGDGVRRAHTHAQGHRQIGVAASVATLREQPQQGVEDRRRPQEHLVEEGELGLGEHSLGAGLDHPLLQPP